MGSARFSDAIIADMFWLPSPPPLPPAFPFFASPKRFRTDSSARCFAAWREAAEAIATAALAGE